MDNEKQKPLYDMSNTRVNNSRKAPKKELGQRSTSVLKLIFKQMKVHIKE